MRVSMRHAHAYAVYLGSAEWRQRRTVALKLAGFRCQRCKSNEMLEVHHLTYDRVGHERPEDLIVLCNPCHADEHRRPAKNDRVVSVDEAFLRAQTQGIELEHMEDEQERVLRAAIAEMPRELRQVLAQLELISHGTTQSWSPSGGGDKEAVFPPGEKTPPHVYWRERWEKATSDDGRANVLAAARKELESLSTRPVAEIKGETEAEFAERVCMDGEGWTVEEVAQRMRCTTSFVRKARLQDGRNVMTGIKPEEMIEGLADKREHARELAKRGLTERQIAMHTGLSKTTVRRVLGRAA